MSNVQNEFAGSLLFGDPNISTFRCGRRVDYVVQKILINHSHAFPVWAIQFVLPSSSSSRKSVSCKSTATSLPKIDSVPSLFQYSTNFLVFWRRSQVQIRSLSASVVGPCPHSDAVGQVRSHLLEKLRSGGSAAGSAQVASYGKVNDGNDGDLT